LELFVRVIGIGFMNNPSPQRRRSNAGHASPFPGDENFDFALWSKLVRQQLITTLQRRHRE
jgi:hypothetical protein